MAHPPPCLRNQSCVAIVSEQASLRGAIQVALMQNVSILLRTFLKILNPDLGHDKLGLQVGLDVGLPHRVFKVQVQGAFAGHAAVAVAAAGLAIGQPLVGPTLVPSSLPAKPLLLHQQLQPLHLTASGTVLCLTQPVTGRLTHVYLALALHQRVQGWRGAAAGAGGH